MEVIAGHDVKDPITRYSEGNVPNSYLKYLQNDDLSGSRIGVLRVLTDDIHPEIKTLFEQAISDLDNLGAEILDPFVVDAFDSLR